MRHVIRYSTLFLGLLLMAGCGYPPLPPLASPTAPTTGATAAILPPPGFSIVDLYSDTELRSLAQFGSTPGSAVKLTDGTHVEIIDYTQKVAYVDYHQPGGSMPVYFKHVRVADGPSRGTEGWIAVQQLTSP